MSLTERPKKVFLSLWGLPMDMNDADRALCVIGNELWRDSKDLHGSNIIGVTNALYIREALRADGFEIVRIK